MTLTATAVTQGLRALCSKMRWSKIMLWLLWSLMLTSCVPGTVRTQAIPPEVLALTAPLKATDESLLAHCPQELPEATDPSIAGLGRNHIEGAAIYHDCSARQSRLSDAVRERERIELERIERARQAIKHNTEPRDRK